MCFSREFLDVVVEGCKQLLRVLACSFSQRRAYSAATHDARASAQRACQLEQVALVSAMVWVTRTRSGHLDREGLQIEHRIAHRVWAETAAEQKRRQVPGDETSEWIEAFLIAECGPVRHARSFEDRTRGQCGTTDRSRPAEPLIRSPPAAGRRCHSTTYAVISSPAK